VVANAISSALRTWTLWATAALNRRGVAGQRICCCCPKHMDQLGGSSLAHVVAPEPSSPDRSLNAGCIRQPRQKAARMDHASKGWHSCVKARRQDRAPRPTPLLPGALAPRWWVLVRGWMPVVFGQIRWHRSHFGSRYKTGCCGHAGLFALSLVRTLLRAQTKPGRHRRDLDQRTWTPALMGKGTLWDGAVCSVLGSAALLLLLPSGAKD